jgi:hypothetical protein
MHDVTMLDWPSTKCRCGHGQWAHVSGINQCKTLGIGGRSCLCTRYVAEDPAVCASRDECMHEILEYVATLDRRYARRPRPPW